MMLPIKRHPVLAFLLLLLATPLHAAGLSQADPFHPSPAFTPAGPGAARGALVWLHGGYDTATQPDPPPEPGWVARMAALGFDVWRFDRAPGTDSLSAGGAGLTTGLTALRHAGYRRVVVAGHSRGGFIALSALAHLELVDAVAAISPAAHGTAASRRPAAMAAFRDLLAAAGRTDLALVLLADDPLEPDAAERDAMAHAMARRTGARLLAIDRPTEPRGHMGGYESNFDRIFGARLVDFLAGPLQ
jgi:pimeloyl-ACP methyl ester carboxylesterase